MAPPTNIWGANQKEREKKIAMLRADPNAKAILDAGYSGTSEMNQRAYSGHMEANNKMMDFGAAGRGLGRMGKELQQSQRIGEKARAGLSYNENWRKASEEERARMIQEEEERLAATGEDFRTTGDKIGGAIAENVLSNVGDAAGGALRGWGNAVAAEGAATQAGAFAEARNEQARQGMMEQAGRDMRDMNAQNAATGLQLTDSAIAQANAFGTGMQGIDSSGIEGSANMERNLQYGQSKADAAEQMQYDMMNNAADDYSKGMAASFSDLSQAKAGAMAGAWTGSMREANNALTEGRTAADAQKHATQATMNDEQMVEAEAERAMTPETPVVEETQEVEREVQQVGAVQPATQQTPAQQPATQQTAAQQPAAGPLSQSNYNELERFLRTKQSPEALTAKMNALGITDGALQKQIQAAVMSGNANWRAGLQKLVK
jgi:hypothetical protein